MSLAKYEFIENSQHWQDCLTILGNAPRMAVDIEADSLYVYREKICLIQISVPGCDYIIDPLCGLDMLPLVALLENSGIEKVFHASEYDLILLKREYGADIQNLFDTMWAARVLGYKSMGLAAFLESHFGVELSKKYQKSNWGTRPLGEEQLEYAQNDTHYLLELRDLLEVELIEKGLLEEAREIFEVETQVRLPDRGFDPEDFWGVKGVRELRPRAQAVLRALFVCREEIARREDKPPFKVLNNSMLIYLAKTKPQKAEAMKNIRGIPAYIKEQYCEELAQAVCEGVAAEFPKLPTRKPRPENAILDRYDRLNEWRKRVARERGVESDVILKRDAMWAIAHENPCNTDELRQHARLGEHRLGLYAESILGEIG